MQAVAASIPLWATLVVILAAFGHGTDADLAAAESGFPRRSFTLPVRTTTLVAWPMALGGLVAASAWLAVAGLLYRRCGVDVPLLWPALFSAGFLACLQAALWWPFPLPILRIVVAALLLGGLASAAVVCIYFQVPTQILATASAALIPIGYGVAVAGVQRARCGGATVWRWRSAPARPSTAPATRPFPTPAAALFWLDWRRNGFAMPLMVALVAGPYCAIMLFKLDAITAAKLLISLAATPLLFALGVGGALGSVNPMVRGARPAPAFMIARPIPTLDMIAVKLRVAAAITLATFAELLLLLLLALPFRGVAEMLADSWRQLLDAHGIKGAMVLAAVVVALPIAVWTTMVSNLWATLTGRVWLIYTFNVGLAAAVTGLFVAWAQIMGNPRLEEGLLTAWPWILSSAVFAKVCLGGVVLGALRRRRILSARRLTQIVAAWMIGAGAIVSLALWLTPARPFSAWTVAGTAVLLLLPGVRLALAPLALEWNRHR
jgi:hypothetical protein